MGDVIFPGSAVVKNRLPMQKAQEMQVRSLGGKYPEEKKTATHSSILAWEIPWTEPGGLQSMRSESEVTERVHVHAHTHTYTHTHTQC